MAELTYVDAEVGRLHAELQKRDPDGVFVVTGDHGIAFDDPRHQRSHYAYDLSTSVLRVPLVVSASFIPPRRHHALTSSLDLAPTLVNLARVSTPAPFLGQSLVPLLATGRSERDGLIFSEFYLPEDELIGRDPLRMVGVRDATFSLVLDRRSGLVEAWNYQRDPFETRDLWSSRNLETRRHLDGMKRKLDEFVNVTHRADQKANSER